MVVVFSVVRAVAVIAPALVHISEACAVLATGDKQVVACAVRERVAAALITVLGRQCQLFGADIEWDLIVDETPLSDGGHRGSRGPRSKTFDVPMRSNYENPTCLSRRDGSEKTASYLRLGACQCQTCEARGEK